MEAAGDRTFGLRRNVGGFKSALINLRKSLPPNAWCGGPGRGTAGRPAVPGSIRAANVLGRPTHHAGEVRAGPKVLVIRRIADRLSSMERWPK